MKKLLYIFTAACLLLAFTGCEDNKTSTSEEDIASYQLSEELLHQSYCLGEIIDLTVFSSDHTIVMNYERGMSGNDYKIELTKENFDFAVIENTLSVLNGVAELMEDSNLTKKESDVLIYVSEKLEAGERSLLCIMQEAEKIKITFSPTLVKKEGLAYPNIWFEVEDATQLENIKNALKR